MKKTAAKSKKRQDILNAARSLFYRAHDVKRVSLEDIAKEAGISPTTIYNNFGDRETLLYEVIREIASQILERNRKIVHSSLPFPQKLISIMNSKMDIINQVNGEILEKLITQNKKISLFIDKLYDQEIKPLWIEIIADGKKQGYIDPAMDNAALIAYLDIIQAGLKQKSELFKNFNDNMNLIKQITHLMFYGFLKKEIDLFNKEGERSLG